MMRMLIFSIAAVIALLGEARLFASENGENGFGIALPEGVTSHEIMRLVAPGADSTLATLVGMKKWPYRQNTYIAIVCCAPDREEFKTDTAYGRNCCNAGYGGFNESANPSQVYLGMVELREKPVLVAASRGPLKVLTSWENSNIESEVGKGDSVSPGIYDLFDFAKYKVSDSQIAFGMRVGWRVMYAGGGGMFYGLMLFMARRGEIVNIFSEPIGEEGMSNGEWREDGSRDKNVWGTDNVVILLSKKTNGYYDIQLREKGGKWKQTFKWNSEANRYCPAEGGP